MYAISIIIPIYNSEPFIERCASSLLEQTLDSIEFVFIDDCSPDRSIDLLEKVIARYPARANDIKIIRCEKNGGQAKARNIGLMNCTGTYVIHCDPDDWVDLDYYEKLYLKARESNSDIVIGDLVYEMEGKHDLYRFKRIKRPNDVLVYDKRKFYLPCHLVKTQLITENCFSFFEGINMWEDTGMLLRIYSKAHSIAYVDDTYYHYNLQNSNSISNSSLLDRLEQQVNCLNRLEAYFHEGGQYLEYVSKIKWRLFEVCCSHKYPVEFTKNVFPDLVHNYVWTRNCDSEIKSKIKMQLYLWNLLLKSMK